MACGLSRTILIVNLQCATINSNLERRQNRRTGFLDLRATHSIALGLRHNIVDVCTVRRENIVLWILVYKLNGYTLRSRVSYVCCMRERAQAAFKSGQIRSDTQPFR